MPSYKLPSERYKMVSTEKMGWNKLWRRSFTWSYCRRFGLSNKLRGQQFAKTSSSLLNPKPDFKQTWELDSKWDVQMASWADVCFLPLRGSCLRRRNPAGPSWDERLIDVDPASIALCDFDASWIRILVDNLDFKASMCLLFAWKRVQTSVHDEGTWERFPRKLW